MWSKLMHRGLFSRILMFYAILMLLVSISVQLYIADTIRERYIDDLKENLLIQTTLIAKHISFKPKSSLDNLCRQYKEETGSRVTIVALDGKVLGDSDTASAQLENHGLRQEIQQAQLDGTGISIRFSDTVKYDFLYVANRIMRQSQPVGYIRLSIPLQKVDHAIDLLIIKILTVVFIVLVITALFSVWQVDRIRKLTRQIRDFSSSLARGEVGKKLFLGRAGEFDEIAESLNIMSLDLQQSMQRTKEEKNRLAVILSSIPDALLISNAKGVVEISSTASRNFFGDIPLEGKHFIEIVRSREFSSLFDSVQRSLKPDLSECALDHPEERFCVVRISPLLYHEENLPFGFIALFHDITKLKKLEQVRQDFVANISHELKTPITAIQGFAETLLEGALQDKAHALQFIETIKANSRRINNLVDDLMTISKIELGIATVQKAPVQVMDIAEAVLAVLQDKAAQKKLSIRTSIAPNVGAISADRDRLIQIVTNLVDNAIKFTDTGEVTIGMTEENRRRCLFVQDTGIGISANHLARLGERFYRVDAGRSRSMGGTGLGLAIVKHLVKAHGWDMRIESTPGKGTKVTIFVI